MRVEKRKSERLALEDISARMYRDNDGVEIDYFPINVSAEGFSIFASSALPVGTQVSLELAAKTVKLVVKWCKPKENDPAAFRCGLERLDKNDRLDLLVQTELAI